MILRPLAVLGLLALAACSALPAGTSDEKTPGGIRVYPNGYAYDPGSVDAALRDVQACVGISGRIAEVHLRSVPFEVVVNGEVVMADGLATARTARVIVGPDLAALRHEMTHVLLWQKTGDSGRNREPGEDVAHCFDVVMPAPNGSQARQDGFPINE